MEIRDMPGRACRIRRVDAEISSCPAEKRLPLFPGKIHPMRFLILLPAVLAGWAQDGATRADWPYYGGTQLAWRYSALDQINSGNVKRLAPAWAFQTGDYEN